MRSIRCASLAILIAACACQTMTTVPETGRRRPALQYTEAQMAELGAEAYRDVLEGAEVVEEGPDVEMVRAVGARLAEASGRDYEWQFALIDDDDVINAFCLPGGKVAVYSGLLPVAEGEQGLAVVLSHEIAHATLQHSNERLSQGGIKRLIAGPVGLVTNVWGSLAPGTRKIVMDGLGLGAVFGRAVPWNQEHESEADRVGLSYMQAAGYDLDEAPEFWERMADAAPPGQVTDSLSTHPNARARAEELRRVIAAMPRASRKTGS